MTDMAPVSANTTIQTAPPAVAPSMLGAALPAWTVILAGLVAIAGLFAQSATYLNHDVAWVLYSSERLLVGGVFGKEIVAANPPLIWWISAVPTFLAKMFGLDPVTTFRLFAVAIAAASLIASERLMRRSVAMLPRGLFVLTGAFLFVAGTGRDFGQREVLAVMLALPYLTAAAGRMHGNVPALAPALLIGAAAGLGIALKPHFIAVPLLIEIILAVRLRTWRIAIRPEACAGVAVAILYALAVVVFAHPWLTGVAPDISRVYWAFSSPLVATLPAYSNVIFISGLLTLVVLLTRRLPVETLVLAAAAAGFLLAAIVQAKAYSYHIYPVTTCLLLALAIAIPVRAMQWRNCVVGMTLAALTANAFGSTRAIWHRSEAGTYGAEAAALVDLVRDKVPAGGSFLAMSTHPYPSFPVANYAGRELASDRNSRIFLPAVIRLRSGVVAPDASLEAFAEGKAHEAMRHDLALKPALVLIDRRPVRHAIGTLPFDYLAFYLEDPAFARAWQAYEKISSPVDGFAVYRLREDVRP